MLDSSPIYSLNQPSGFETYVMSIDWLCWLSLGVKYSVSWRSLWNVLPSIVRYSRMLDVTEAVDSISDLNSCKLEVLYGDQIRLFICRLGSLTRCLPVSRCRPALT